MLAGGHCQTARVPQRDLLVLTEEPLNAETRLEGRRGPVTPAGSHYVRTHFPVPDGPREIVVDGVGGTPISISLDQIRALPARTLLVTLECAGNGRRFLDPPAPGEPWGLGAVGTARWTGASLRSVLELAAPPAGAIEVLFRGADDGVPKDLGRRIAYERSLPIDVAFEADALIAYQMEGVTIPPEHGGPLRLVVPGWYGMASVKWLARIRLLDRPFAGFFQTDRYVIDGRPVRHIEPRAVITWPPDGATLREAVEVRGYAWSGRAPVALIELEEGGRRLAAVTPGRANPYAWQEFAFTVPLGSGEHTLLVRATDRAGNTQPDGPRANALGYANNAPRPVRVRVS